MDIDPPTSKAELEDALDLLVQKAYQNDVEVADCGYELFHEQPSIPDWDLTIIRMDNSNTHR